MRLLQAIERSDMVRLMLPDGARYAPTQKMIAERPRVTGRPSWCPDGIEFDHNGSRWRCELVPAGEHVSARVWTFGSAEYMGEGEGADGNNFAEDPEEHARQHWYSEDPGIWLRSAPGTAASNRNEALYRFVLVEE